MITDQQSQTRVPSLPDPIQARLNETLPEHAETPPIADLSPAEFSYFPTTIFRFDLPNAKELNAQLVPTIYAGRDADEEGLEKSNEPRLGGWHSRGNLSNQPGYETLVRFINQATAHLSSELRYDESRRLKISSMWSIINPPGAFNIAHVHPGCMWSGVYYAQAPEDCGKISFTDPRVISIMKKPYYSPDQKVRKKCWTKVNFPAVAGRMLLFPSWLYHSVSPNFAKGEGRSGDRVIISFNLNQVKI